MCNVKHFTLLPFGLHAPYLHSPSFTGYIWYFISKDFTERAGKPQNLAGVARAHEKIGAQEWEEWRAGTVVDLLFFYCSYMHPGKFMVLSPFFYFGDFSFLTLSLFLSNNRNK